jgi:hypothetical protein
MTSDYIIAIMPSDTIVALVIPLVALLTSPPVMWRKEHLWNFGVIQTVSIPIQYDLFQHCEAIQSNKVVNFKILNFCN